MYLPLFDSAADMVPLTFTSRPAQVAALLAASFGVPYAYHNYGTAGSDSSSAASSSSYPTGISYGPDGTLLSANPAHVTNPGLRDFRQFVRFDITPGWVASTFPRVSTVLSNVQMDGLRVPVVTGTGPQDFAGTTDYYFDRLQQPRRIVLDGYCGDPSAIASVLVQYYGLKAEPALGGHLFVSRWNNRITSVAMFQPAPVIYAEDSHKKFSIFIEINQPSMEYGLSEKSEQILRNAWQNLRWQ